MEVVIMVGSLITTSYPYNNLMNSNLNQDAGTTAGEDLQVTLADPIFYNNQMSTVTYPDPLIQFTHAGDALPTGGHGFPASSTYGEALSNPLVPLQPRGLLQIPTRGFPMPIGTDLLVDSIPNIRFANARGRKTTKGTTKLSRGSRTAPSSLSTTSRRSRSHSTGIGPTSPLKASATEVGGGLNDEWPMAIYISASGMTGVVGLRADPTHNHFQMTCPNFCSLVEDTVLAVINHLTSYDLFALGRSESDLEATLEREYRLVLASKKNGELMALEPVYTSISDVQIALDTDRLPPFVQNVILGCIDDFFDYALQSAYQVLFLGGFYNLRADMSLSEIMQEVARMIENEHYLTKLGSVKQGERPQPLMFQHLGVKTLLLRLFYSGRYSMANRSNWSNEVPINAIASINLFFHIVLEQHEQTGQRNLQHRMSSQSQIGITKYASIHDMIATLRRYAIAGPIFDTYRKSLPGEFRQVVLRANVSKIYPCDGDSLL